MNKESFWMNPIKGYGEDIMGNKITKEEANKSIKNRQGYQVKSDILRKYKVATVFHLTKKQIDECIIKIHQSVIRGT
jgi:hypothetical protein